MDTTHVNVHADHLEDLLGRILLERVPVEFPASLVPFDRVQHVALHVVVAGQHHVLTCSHGSRNTHLIDLYGLD